MKIKASTPHNLQILTEQEFSDLVKRKAAPTDIAVVKGCIAEVKGIKGQDNFTFTISTESVDRDKDVISVAGWDLTSYKQNPVVLWAHDYKSLPLGTSKSITPSKGGLTATMQFVPKDVYPFADTVRQMVELGILRAASVGFKPLKYSYNEDRKGVDVSESELLEWSIVPVPANADCLVQLSMLPKGLCDQFSGECERFLSEIKGKGQWVVGEQITSAMDHLIKIASTAKKDGQPAVGESHVGHPSCKREGGCPTNADGSPENCTMADCPMKQPSVVPPESASVDLGDSENALKIDDEDQHLIGISLEEIDTVLRNEFRGYVKGLVTEQMTAQFNYLLGRID